VSAPWWAGDAADTRRGSGRTWTTRGVLTGAAAFVVIAAAATIGATSPHVAESETTAYGQVVRPSVQALAAGCGASHFVVEPASWIGTLPGDGELTYEPSVPVSGWFSEIAAAPGDLKAPPEQVLRSMWSGARAIWVAADASSQTTDTLEAMVASHPQWHAVVRQWPAGRIQQLEPGTYSPAAWGLTQSCHVPDADVIDALFAAAPLAPGSDPSTAVPVFGAHH
jgi:hypothetical protein